MKKIEGRRKWATAEKTSHAQVSAEGLVWESRLMGGREKI